MQIKLVAHNSPEYRQAVELRRQVLRLPIGLDFTEDELAKEENDLHLVAVDSRKGEGFPGPIKATLSLVDLGEHKIKMRQVAVDPTLQRSGLGTQLVQASEQIAKDRGFTQMQLHARDTAVPFYTRLGYEIVGDEFTEVGIPHRKMIKRL